MNFLLQQLSQFQSKLKSIDSIEWMDISKKKLSSSPKESIQAVFSRHKVKTGQQLLKLHHNIKHIGAPPTMDDYEKRKLGIFNQLNFFQLVTGILIPVIGLYNNKKFPDWAWLVASIPAIISMVVLLLNANRKYEAGIIFYFIFYPVVTSIVYMSGISLGIELLFILYGILSVFFLQEISHMLFSVSLSMISYFMLAVVWKDHTYQLASSNTFLYLFNEFLCIVFIFYGLFIIKKENADYQSSVVSKNKEIAETAGLLQKQTVELTELNTLKNKLFSVISHDLKTPMYALRNLFRTIQQQNLPAEEIKNMLPDVINDLNYTTGLMENLLQWAKSQMQSECINTQKLDISKMIAEVIQLLKLQADAKQLWIESKMDPAVYIMADKDMISLVLRNLLSNAIKFTPEKGRISIGVNEMPSYVEVFIKDTGTGISEEALHKINGNDYYTTNGTAHEQGTGLGLMLCKEFLGKNGGQMCIESEPGEGSVFSFTLPKPE
jgi:two-component system, sensor histidine kinase and response regulator